MRRQGEYYCVQITLRSATHTGKLLLYVIADGVYLEVTAKDKGFNAKESTTKWAARNSGDHSEAVAAKPADRTLGFDGTKPRLSPSETTDGQKSSTESPTSPRAAGKPPGSPNRNQTAHYTPKNAQSIRAHKLRSLLIIFSRPSPPPANTPVESRRSKLDTILPIHRLLLHKLRRPIRSYSNKKYALGHLDSFPTLMIKSMKA